MIRIVTVALGLALCAGTGHGPHVERVTGNTVSSDGLAQGAIQPSVSADGRYVAAAVNEAPIVDGAYQHSAGETYVWDRKTRQTTLVSRIPFFSYVTPARGVSQFPRVSASGRYVAYQSAYDYTPQTSIYVLDRDADGNGEFDGTSSGAWRIITISPPLTGQSANGRSYRPCISASGRYVAFSSYAYNLVAGDTNGPASGAPNPGPPVGVGCDVFIRDRDADGNGVFDESGAAANKTLRVSVDSMGQQTNPHANSQNADLSGDGRFVAFDSDATSLAPGDTNGLSDVFVHDRDADGNGVMDEPGGIQTTRISVGLGGESCDGASFMPGLSRDGRFVVFQSSATNILPVGVGRFPTQNVYLFDRITAQMTLVSAPPSGGFADGPSFDAVVSGNGRFVAFVSLASNLVPGDTNSAADVFLYDRLSLSPATRLIRVSLTAALGQSRFGGNSPAISADGSVVCFASASLDLVAGDTNKVRDIFAYVRP
ncbi:MAG: hypothetical protein U1A27_00375 [Phycisphaerae bacterium]